MNVLYIGPYRQNDTWGLVSRSILKGLSLVKDINLVSRPLFFINQSITPSIDIIQAERKKITNFDWIIQHTLPHTGQRVCNAKHMLLCALESNLYKEHVWNNYASIFDVVSTDFCLDFHKQETSLDIPVQYKDIYKIGYMGSMAETSGLKEIIMAYFLGFRKYEALLTVYLHQDTRQAPEFIKKIKQDLKLYNNDALYPEISIVDAPPSDDLYHKFINSVDTYISAGYSSYYDINTIMALEYNKLVFTTTNYNTSEINRLQTHQYPLISSSNPRHNTFTGRESCNRPDIYGLIEAMKTRRESNYEGYFSPVKFAERIYNVLNG